MTRHTRAVPKFSRRNNEQTLRSAPRRVGLGSYGCVDQYGRSIRLDRKCKCAHLYANVHVRFLHAEVKEGCPASYIGTNRDT